jgi:hypothetical protein
MPVCFLLERDTAVSGITVAVHGKLYEPFEQVKDVEPDIEQFFHLSGMDTLMGD